MISAFPAPAEEAAEVDPIAAAVTHPDRSDDHRGRDADRKPAEVLAFFGVEPGMQVADCMPGDGYYTEMLARIVGADGHVYAQNNALTLKYYGNALDIRIVEAGLENVTQVQGGAAEPGLPADLDAVFLIRFYHDFVLWEEDRNQFDRAAFNRAVFAALKPGGVYAVIDHHARDGSGLDDRKLHRIDAAVVRQEIEAAGFVLDAESNLLRNPGDSRDWFLFVDNGARRDQTDRFIYRFRKPDKAWGSSHLAMESLPELPSNALIPPDTKTAVVPHE